MTETRERSCPTARPRGAAQLLTAGKQSVRCSINQAGKRSASASALGRKTFAYTRERTAYGIRFFEQCKCPGHDIAAVAMNRGDQRAGKARRLRSIGIGQGCAHLIFDDRGESGALVIVCLVELLIVCQAVIVDRRPKVGVSQREVEVSFDQTPDPVLPPLAPAFPAENRPIARKCAS